MDLTIGWSEIAWRLSGALLAGAAIGINRGERGRPAGLRTNVLVCLAACITMVLVNLLLPVSGKGPTSFVTADVMHLPAAILSGMGFIGAGAILHRGDFIVGVTTAATLWFVTVLGLCMGSGHIGLGTAGTALGLGVLWLLQYVERRLPLERSGTFVLTVADDGPSEKEVRQTLELSGFRIESISIGREPATHRRRLACDVNWRGRRSDTAPPPFVEHFAQAQGVESVEWTQHRNP
jgi:putative Mg2+ transporter-C (MgtC) family protein